MATIAGMKGVAVRNQGGTYVFYPAYDPSTNEKCLGIPLGNGSSFLVSITDAANLQPADPTRCRPVQGGAYMAAPDTARGLPFQLTAAIAEETRAIGYTRALGRFVFYWNGSGTVYLSSSSSSKTNVQINDGIIISSPRGSHEWKQDPGLDALITVSGISVSDGPLIQEGINVVNVTLKNNYTDKFSCSAIYLIRG